MDNLQPDLALITEGLPLDPEVMFRGAHSGSLSPEDLLNVVPATLDETVANIRNLDDGNDFSKDRIPYIDQFRAIVYGLFDRHAPMEEGLTVLEVGPGPQAYALTRKILPLERIASLTMLELSEAYLRKVKGLVRFKPKPREIIVWYGDVHTFELSEEHQGFDVVYCASSLDSSPYVREAIRNIPHLLKDDGVMIVTQDVYPSHSSIAALASQRGIELGYDGNVDFGARSLSGPIVWIKDEQGLVYPSATFLINELARFSHDAGLDVREQGVWGASLIVSPENKQRYGDTKSVLWKRRASLLDNYLVGYMDNDVTFHDPELRGHLAVGYFMDVLVVGKS